ncbi:MAG TPA: hypothetical protein VJZ69_00295 [Clostridia bacterium]|nr:hypothetical protein [Clostridia bacterium]
MIMQCIVCLACILSVDSAVMSVDKVVATKSFETSNVVVVAALTQPICSHKEICAIKEKIQNAVLETGIGKRVIVSFDLDIYAKIKAEMTMEQKVKLIEILDSRQS